MDKTCSGCGHTADECRRVRDEEDAARLRAEARRWYLADGSFEELEPEVVIERRKQAARDLAAWKKGVEDANRIAQEHDAARAQAEEANATLVAALDVAQHQARLAEGLAAVRQEELLRIGGELAELRRARSRGTSKCTDPQCPLVHTAHVEGEACSRSTP